MRMNLIIAALCDAIISTAPASAAVFLCDGIQVADTGIDNGGTLWLRSSLGNVNICNVVSQSGNTPPDACRSWLAEIMTVRANSGYLTLYFTTDDPTNASLAPSQCTASNFNGTGWEEHHPFYLEFH